MTHTKPSSELASAAPLDKLALHQKITEQCDHITGRGPFYLAIEDAIEESGTAGYERVSCTPQQLASKLLDGTIKPSTLIYRVGMEAQWLPVEKTPVVLVLNEAEAHQVNTQETTKQLTRKSENDQPYPERIGEYAPQRLDRTQLPRTMWRYGLPATTVVNKIDSPLPKKIELPLAFARFGITSKEQLNAILTSGFKGMSDDMVRDLEQLVERFKIDHVKTHEYVKRIESAHESSPRASGERPPTPARDTRGNTGWIATSTSEEELRRKERLRQHPGFYSEDRDTDKLP